MRSLLSAVIDNLNQEFSKNIDSLHIEEELLNKRKESLGVFGLAHENIGPGVYQSR